MLGCGLLIILCKTNWWRIHLVPLLFHYSLWPNFRQHFLLGQFLSHFLFLILCILKFFSIFIFLAIFSPLFSNLLFAFLIVFATLFSCTWSFLSFCVPHRLTPTQRSNTEQKCFVFSPWSLFLIPVKICLVYHIENRENELNFKSNCIF